MTFHLVLWSCIFYIVYNRVDVCEAQNQETVLVTSSSNMKYIKVPTSDDPLLTWMEVRKGTFPNVTNDLDGATNVTVGDPITLFIFYKDNSNLYEIAVTDCWAYDEKIPFSTQKFHLSGKSSENKNDKILTKWKKFKTRKSASFLYASFNSFKFPEKDQIYLTCDIQLVGREQT